MRRKNFIGSSEGILMTIIHESWGRKNDSNAVTVETTEEQPIPCMFNSKRYVPVDEVPESVEDIEESLIESIDAGEEDVLETFESIGNPQALQCPRHFKIIKYFRNLGRRDAGAAVASINARTGVIALSF